MLNLLVKFYEPMKGTIRLSNEQTEQIVRDIEEQSLRKRIGYVGQEPILLGKTLREVLSADEYEDRRIREVLNMCCICDLAEEIGLDVPFKHVSGG